MTLLEARITTDRASRYLVQLCRHAAAMGSSKHRPRFPTRAAHHERLRVHADWDERQGLLTFDPPARATLHVGPTALTVRIDADDEHTAQLVRDVLTRSVQRFGRRDNLTVDWHTIDAQAQ